MGAKKRVVTRFAKCAFWLLLAVKAEAGPPFSTDDPDVPPDGGWEINIPFTLSHESGSTFMNTPLFDLNYGLPQLQLEFDVPVVVPTDQSRTTAGLGDLLYGVKWKFLENEQTKFTVAIYPQMPRPPAMLNAGSATAGRILSYQCWRKRPGENGPSTAMSVIEWRWLTQKETIGTPAQFYNGRSTIG